MLHRPPHRRLRVNPAPSRHYHRPFLASHTLFLHSSYRLLIYHVIGMFILFTLCFFPQEQGFLDLEAIDILGHVIVCCWGLSWAFWDVSAASPASPPTRDASRTPFLGGDDLEKASPDLDQCPWQGEGATSPPSQDLSHKDLRSVRTEIFVSLTVASPAPTV